MDPDAVWETLCASLHDLEKDPDNPQLRKHVIDLLNVLSIWLDMDGLPPKTKEKQ